MPYKIVKTKGSRPYKIVKKSTGKIVGSSTSMGMAKKAMAARYENEPKNKTS